MLDAKIDLISATGFVPFIEVSRREAGPAWKKYHDWPNSYVRYIQYVFTGYQGHNAIFSPIHYDYYLRALSVAEYNVACNAWLDRYGRPPFGTMPSANANPSTLANFGTDARWLDLHQTGNAREHYTYRWMTEMYHAEPRLPAIAGEPYTRGSTVSAHRTSSASRATHPRTTCTCDLACMAACCRAVTPATSTARKEFGSHPWSLGLVC